MKIALLSDTHGSRERTVQAIRLLQSEPVQAVLHAGDIGDAEILTELGAAFAPRGAPVHAVEGNVDSWDAAIRRFPRDRGVTVYPVSAELVFDGKRVFLTHGHRGAVLDAAIEGGAYDYVIHGHTHVRRDEQVGPTRVINPGAVQRSSEPGVAVLDLEDGRLRFLNL